MPLAIHGVSQFMTRRVNSFLPLLLGEVADRRSDGEVFMPSPGGHRHRNAACGGLNEVRMAQRSKPIGAPSRNRLWEPQEGFFLSWNDSSTASGPPSLRGKADQKHDFLFRFTYRIENLHMGFCIVVGALDFALMKVIVTADFIFGIVISYLFFN